MTPYIYTGLTKPAQRLFINRVPQLTHEKIIKIVCSEFMVSENDLKSRAKNREIVMPRQISMHIIRESTTMGLKAIGDVFNRHHSTVISAINTVNDLIETDKNFKSKYEQIQRKITSQD